MSILGNYGHLNNRLIMGYYHSPAASLMRASEQNGFFPFLDGHMKILFVSSSFSDLKYYFPMLKLPFGERKLSLIWIGIVAVMQSQCSVDSCKLQLQ